MNVPDRKTPLTLAEMIAALATGYEKTLGGMPSARCLAVLTAQACLETANGAALHCWNFGNVKASPDWDGLVCQYACDELVTPAQAAAAKRLPGPCSIRPSAADGSLVRVVVSPPHPWTSFRAFSSVDDGAAAFVAFYMADKWRRAWSRAFAGDSAGFVRELKMARYFTGPEDAYTRSVSSIAAKVLPACQQLVAGVDHAIPADEAERISGLVALTLDQVTFLRVPVSPDEEVRATEPERIA